MKLNQSSTQQQTFDPYNLRGRLPMTPVWKDPNKAKERWDRAFDYLAKLKRPNPPTPEMVQRAQPYRADTLQELEAVIKYPAKSIDV
jgi:hypothetical protein